MPRPKNTKAEPTAATLKGCGYIHGNQNLEKTKTSKTKLLRECFWSETTFDKRNVSDYPQWQSLIKEDQCVVWEQWMGLLQRGLTRLKPGMTGLRAPGPGPIKKQDWAPLG